MKNFIQKGETVEFTNGTGADLAAGDAVLIGGLIGVCVSDVANTALGVASVEGVYELPKLSTDDMDTIGQLVNWNDTNLEFQEATSDLDGAAAVWETAAAATTVVRVKINP